MYPLSHITFACGVVWAGSRLIERARPGQDAQTLATPALEPLRSPSAAEGHDAHTIDYRLVAFGALLPDLIDKPLGWIFLRKFFRANDHLFGHTLLFGSALVLAGLLQRSRSGDARLLTVGAGALAHLPCDPVTRMPQTVFWPLMGWSFLPKARGAGIIVNCLIEVGSACVLLLIGRSLSREDRLDPLLDEGRI
ncbi:MAG: metal-dependent hydrolase [Dehalococcoidia bacterium]